MEIIGNVITAVKANWAEIVLIYLAAHKLLVTIRDVFDSTPNTDDNAFERIVTVLGKLADYLVKGKRP